MLFLIAVLSRACAERVVLTSLLLLDAKLNDVGSKEHVRIFFNP
jgi:hypothetical protein